MICMSLSIILKPFLAMVRSSARFRAGIVSVARAFSTHYKQNKNHISSGGSIMAGKPRLAVFEEFIQSARAFCAANSDSEARMKKIKILFQALVNDPSLR